MNPGDLVVMEPRVNLVMMAVSVHLVLQVLLVMLVLSVNKADEVHPVLLAQLVAKV